MASKQKYYVVWKGRKTGVFSNWDDCSAQVIGYPGAKYKSFQTKEEATRAFNGNYEDYKGSNIGKPDPKRVSNVGTPILESYSVDASCIGNPGVLEYRGVYTKTGEVIFKQGPFDRGTNNIGEFLAIVHALALSKTKNINIPIYSDSENAIGWVKKKKCKTRLVEDKRNSQLFELIRRAEAWISNNDYLNEILKWETDVWGEIPADYGRK